MTKDQKPAANENNDGEELQPIPEFIAGVLTKARAADGADVELLDILEERIVHDQPLLSLTDMAHSDIEALAEKRAKKEKTDDGSDHN